MWEAIALSFGLAMDATAVSAARGLGGHLRRELVILPLVFGGFQAGMSALGWLAGQWIGPYIARWQGPVAFGLLALIGLKMIVDGVRGQEDPEHVPPGTIGVYLGLGIATSIDAGAAGLTLETIAAPPWLSIVLIGAITGACSAIGYGAGRALGGRLGPRLGILGGVVLVGIGIDIWIGSR
jgi:manganese efflux pump family protein